ncbi:DoxX family protein [Actinosynnema sp. NPDC047251]|uniref:Putative membrane protein n=1 Tax=Saccharothrix espanaensis (strain ATCC 51144 / DSM 44229 / JCM 9112 / NBRC 15066 / NRRL 15764) TaxID=1179773 RepID=K0JNK5_SACES|nr:DoxX family protein [Saccharothrix espanaensis]CCH27345.1 putative membrane protein [Saccharothrix espanaensis DSM 44229]
MNVIDRGRDHALAVFRIVVGVLFVCHGAQKLFGVLGSKGSVSITSWPAGPAGLIELVGGALIVLGLGTRIAALISSGAMAYAYFVVHQPEGLLPIQNHGELAAVYAWVFLLLVFTGPGSWALDKVIASRKQDNRSATLANA